VINIVFDDEYLRQIAELMITGFLGWMSLQPEAEKMLAAFERVMNALDQEHVEPIHIFSVKRHMMRRVGCQALLRTMILERWEGCLMRWLVAFHIRFQRLDMTLRVGMRGVSFLVGNGGASYGRRAVGTVCGKMSL